MNLFQRINRRLLSAVSAALIGGQSQRTKIDKLLADRRVSTFREALEFIDYEKVPGEILEFGVFTGRSLAAFTYLARHERGWAFSERRVVGFDSFQGLRGMSEHHARWCDGACSFNHERGNPVLNYGEPVTPEAVRKVFAYYDLGEPFLEVGDYSQTIPRVAGKKYERAALVHIDCDLYESTRTVLFGLEPLFQDGTFLLFDDWFHYRANPRRGEARALQEFKDATSGKWEVVHYRAYGVFCNAFVLSRL